MVFVGRSFGQERPPLTDLLKNILLRYPDGGQILKVSELTAHQGFLGCPLAILSLIDIKLVSELRIYDT